MNKQERKEARQRRVDRRAAAVRALQEGGTRRGPQKNTLLSREYSSVRRDQAEVHFESRGNNYGYPEHRVGIFAGVGGNWLGFVPGPVKPADWCLLRRKAPGETRVRVSRIVEHTPRGVLFEFDKSINCDEQLPQRTR